MGRKVKYAYEFKLRCVKAVLNGCRSCKSVAKEQGFNEANLRLWVGFYQTYGKSGLKPRRTQHYDRAFELEVIKTMDKEFLSLRAACVRFNIPSDSIIIGWKRAYESKGLSGLANQPRGRPKKMKHPIKKKPGKSDKPLIREDELLRENEYLRAENELLKKLQALYEHTKALIQAIYHKHKGRLGYRRITLALRQKGVIVNHKTVLRLMKSLGLKSVIRVKKYKSYKGEVGKVAPNVLNRVFKAKRPNQKWATDITEFNVSGKKIYLSPIIDLYNQEIISYEPSCR